MEANKIILTVIILLLIIQSISSYPTKYTGFLKFRSDAYQIKLERQGNIDRKTNKIFIKKNIVLCGNTPTIKIVDCLMYFTNLYLFSSTNYILIESPLDYLQSISLRDKRLRINYIVANNIIDFNSILDKEGFTYFSINNKDLNNVKKDIDYYMNDKSDQKQMFFIDYTLKPNFSNTLKSEKGLFAK